MTIKVKSIQFHLRKEEVRIQQVSWNSDKVKSMKSFELRIEQVMSSDGKAKSTKDRASHAKRMTKPSS